MPRFNPLLLLPLLAATLAAPLAFFTNNLSETDAAEIYVILGPAKTLDRLLARPEVQEIGPYRAPFGRMVKLTPTIHASLVQNDYWIVPGSAIAALCGINSDVQVRDAKTPSG